MIRATLTSASWRADQPKETVYEIAEDSVAYNKIKADGTAISVTFGELFSAFSPKLKGGYVKDAGYENVDIKPESFELWFFKTYVPKSIFDRLISKKYEIL